MVGQRRRFAIALGTWLGSAAVFFIAAQRAGGVDSVVAALLAGVKGTTVGALTLGIIYLIRPLLLLPATILTAFCGYAFGPWLGLLIAHVGGLVSALVGYTGARLWLGLPDSASSQLRERLRTRGFETVLISRLAFVPGDLVNAAAGGLAMPLAPFVLATAIGGLPGSLVSVFAGASMADGAFSVGGIQIRPAFVIASGSLALVSFAVAFFLRRRQRV